MSTWTYRQSDGKAASKIVPPRLRIPCWKGLSADSEEKREPASDIDTVVVDCLKALDPKWPIREVDIGERVPLASWTMKHCRSSFVGLVATDRAARSGENPIEFHF